MHNTFVLSSAYVIATADDAIHVNVSAKDGKVYGAWMGLMGLYWLLREEYPERVARRLYRDGAISKSAGSRQWIR